MLYITKLKKRIKNNEGYSNAVYLDQLGYPTIGYGHLIKKKEQFSLKGTFKKKYLNDLFDTDFNKAFKDFKKNYDYKKLKVNVKEVIIEMIFQLGIKNVKKFKKFNNCVKNNLLYLAALEMLDSKWYSQTPKRVDGLIETLLGFNYEKKRRQ